MFFRLCDKRCFFHESLNKERRTFEEQFALKIVFRTICIRFVIILNLSKCASNKG